MDSYILGAINLGLHGLVIEPHSALHAGVNGLTVFDVQSLHHKQWTSIYLCTFVCLLLWLALNLCVVDDSAAFSANKRAHVVRMRGR